MSKNYRNYYQSEAKKEIEAQPELETVQSEQEVEVKSESEKKESIGVVCNCAKLNVRVHPSTDANIVYQVVGGEELMIDLKKSTKDFYAVWNGAGVQGYCMKQYISVKQ